MSLCSSLPTPKTIHRLQWFNIKQFFGTIHKNVQKKSVPVIPRPKPFWECDLLIQKKVWTF